MTQSKCIGLIGGLGVGATILYYQELVKAHAALGRVAQITVAHADVAQVLRFVGQNDLSGLAEYLAGFARRLQAAGSTMLALTGIAPHACAKQLVSLSPIPLIDLVAETARHIRAAGYKRIASLGTRFAMETALFGRLQDVEIIRRMAMSSTASIKSTCRSWSVEAARRTSGTNSPQSRKG